MEINNILNPKELVILTSRDHFFGQTRKPWTSLDVRKMADILEKNGFNVCIYDFHEVINQKIRLQNKLVFYAFSQKENYRQYIRDVVYYLSKNNEVIPSYDLLKCHENKGFQEIHKKELGFKSLNASYYTSLLEVDVDRLQFPLVLKTSSGTNGKGVFLLKNKADFFRVTKGLRSKFGLLVQLDLLRRKYFRKKKFAGYPNYSDLQDYREYKEYLRQEENFVLQEYVPGLDHDYRVLVANDRFYVMKRSVKNGDFRASGSKIFDFSTKPDKALLSYAQAVYEKFDAPFLSLDIMFDGKNYYLGEFQALHFGMSVVARSKGFFRRAENDDWCFAEEKPDLERLFAQTLTAYIEKAGKETESWELGLPFEIVYS